MIAQIIVLGSGMVDAGAIHWHRDCLYAPISAIIEPSVEPSVEPFPYTSYRGTFDLSAAILLDNTATGAFRATLEVGLPTPKRAPIRQLMLPPRPIYQTDYG